MFCDFFCLVNFCLSGCHQYSWSPFSIASLNVDGICDDDKRTRIFEYLRSLKHDFFLLQETHGQTEDIEAWSAEWGVLAFGALVETSPGV